MIAKTMVSNDNRKICVQQDWPAGSVLAWLKASISVYRSRRINRRFEARCHRAPIGAREKEKSFCLNQAPQCGSEDLKKQAKVGSEVCILSTFALLS